MTVDSKTRIYTFDISIADAPVCVFTGSGLITRLDRIRPEIGHLALFLTFLIVIMFIKYVYDHNNDVWIIRLGILGHSDH